MVAANRQGYGELFLAGLFQDRARFAAAIEKMGMPLHGEEGLELLSVMVTHQMDVKALSPERRAELRKLVHVCLYFMP